MKEILHNLRVFLSKFKIPISATVSCIIFYFFITNFPTTGRRGVALFIGISEIIGIPMTVFVISAIWFGLMCLFLDYDDYGKFEKNKQEYNDTLNSLYSQAAQELQDKEKIRMDIWGKALLEAKGNEELAKAKYIKIRVKEAE